MRSNITEAGSYLRPPQRANSASEGTPGMPSRLAKASPWSVSGRPNHGRLRCCNEVPAVHVCIIAVTVSSRERSLGRVMQLSCPSCTKTLEFSVEAPRFCGYCGQSLTIATEAVTVAPLPADPDRTAPPDPAMTLDLSASAVPDTSISGTIGGYRLLRKLGGGGMGAVYEAEEIASGRRVALKIVLPGIAGSAETLTRFRQEGKLASTLAHPRCVFVLSADEEAGRPYIVMELMPGHTLSDLVRDRGPLPPEEAIAKTLDVMAGLQEPHRRGLVHGDVKPSNCFLEVNGRVKIGDFGLARSLEVDAKLTRTGSFVGTPLYAAPEQIHKKEPTD